MKTLIATLLLVLATSASAQSLRDLQQRQATRAATNQQSWAQEDAIRQQTNQLHYQQQLRFKNRAEHLGDAVQQFGNLLDQQEAVRKYNQGCIMVPVFSNAGVVYVPSC